ncbi:MAG: chromosome segregation protein SMC [Gammaproteobacteria bacterium]|nr:chromosome segregation protein SMC [Gammaproteobacteria bacterium]
MRLSKIKLAGFKSFVDPITIDFPSNLVGVVGPNGCGKSNIIDAVRWVMGESSAKTLRGDSMADVIFNGSSSRKPASTASIELIFDNADGTIGGQYAAYTEISVMRKVTKDGTSDYFLNGTKCRRKDITGIFLGTGLGPRSYSIIEQGMVSKLIEAKPEDLRVFLEEAAGISKYKERRRETSNRIKHTRENLDRLNDLREEIEKQLLHLDRQAKAAEKYKLFKQEERQAKAELLALRLRDMQGQSEEQEKFLNEHETAVQKVLAAQREIEASIEKSRQEQTAANDTFNEAQGRFYKTGSDISRLEQGIQHAKELRQRQQEQLGQTENAVKEIQSHIKRDQEQIAIFAEEIRELEPQQAETEAKLQASRSELEQAEENMQTWMREWEELNAASSEAQKSTHVERTRIEHLESQMSAELNRRDKLRTERGTFSLGSFEQKLTELMAGQSSQESMVSQLQARLDETTQNITSLREQERELGKSLDGMRREQQKASGRLASLKALQEAALGKKSDHLNAWLKKEGLDAAPRLGESLQVNAGWEKALETVLGPALEAVCVDSIRHFVDDLAQLQSGHGILVDKQQNSSTQNSLAQQVQGEFSQLSVLQSVYTAPSLSAALQQQNTLKSHESVITADGVWLGPDWVRVSRDEDTRAGVLAREQETRELESTLAELDAQISAQAEQQQQLRSQIKHQEQERDEQQSEANRANRQFADLRARLESQQEQRSELSARITNMDSDLATLEQRISDGEVQTREARTRLDAALNTLAGFADKQQELDGTREAVRSTLQAARSKAHADQEQYQALAVRFEARKAAHESLTQNLERMQNQIAQLEEQSSGLQRQLRVGVEPQKAQEQELADLLKQSVEIENEVKAARNALEEIETKLKQQEQDRLKAEGEVQVAREELQKVTLALQEIRVRRDTVNEQLQQTGFAFAELAEQLDEEATIEAWQERLALLERRIQRLGAINLAAIEEFKEQSERKIYLDQQNDDLTEALDILENAIKKIDKETRTRFKETFDKVNQGFKEKFPRLFGGGHAYLELTGDDLLDTGVTVMARPPGKRNSTIHLLSGGEKALTAVALVFSIFDLNPAPFCMLDEVDAPLDDANVGRYCDIVRSMSDRVQFIFITHNKITMEMAKQLSGVTMHEPGVSRIVAVDVDEAVEMANL